VSGRRTAAHARQTARAGAPPPRVRRLHRLDDRLHALQSSRSFRPGLSTHERPVADIACWKRYISPSLRIVPRRRLGALRGSTDFQGRSAAADQQQALASSPSAAATARLLLVVSSRFGMPAWIT